MNLDIIGEDPFKVLSSTKPVVESLKFIKIQENNLDSLAFLISEKLKNGIDSGLMHFGKTESFENDVQLIFLEDVVNFCFWAEKGKQKWEVVYPKGSNPMGGWYSLTKCFQRAIAEKAPILNAEFLINLTKNQVQSIFQGTNGTNIPLLDKRLENLKEAGLVLEKKYNGQFLNALETADFDAIKIVKLLLKDFPSFKDITDFEGERIYFLKRAQICSQDFSYLYKDSQRVKIKNVEQLTAFADYKIPQMLRKYDAITYDKDLAEKIDNYVLIPKESREEIEIRSVTIWCMELIKQRLEKFTTADIDNALWLISQNQLNVKPYHRTYTIYY